MEPSGEAVAGQSYSSRIVTSMFLMLFAVSLLGNVYQGWRLRALSFSMAPRNQRSPENKTGELIPFLNVMTVSGRPSPVRLKGGPSVIYIFDPACRWCARNLANFQALAQQTKAGYRFIAVSRSADGLQKYVDSTNLPGEVYVGSRAELDRLDFSGTPQTIVLDIDGRVIHNWPGAYSGSLKNKIEQYFRVDLPGLQ